jgi:hypothetical protein
LTLRFTPKHSFTPVQRQEEKNVFHQGRPNAGNQSQTAKLSTVVGATDYSPVDVFDIQHKFGNVGAGESPGSPNWWSQKRENLY